MDTWVLEDGTYHLVPVDRCLSAAVRGLAFQGIGTVSSCCGHGEQPGVVELEDGRVLLVFQREVLDGFGMWRLVLQVLSWCWRAAVEELRQCWVRWMLK